MGGLEQDPGVRLVSACTLTHTFKLWWRHRKAHEQDGKLQKAFYFFHTMTKIYMYIFLTGGTGSVSVAVNQKKLRAP